MPYTSALRIENLRITYKDLGGDRFSKPRALGFFEKEDTTTEKDLMSDANIELMNGETLCVSGPSGLGKSALLRVIAGLIRPTSGKFYYFGEYIPPERHTALEIAKRQVGLVFQNGALISNLRIKDNIALPLLYHRMGSPKEIEDKVNMAMDLMRVRSEANLFPHQLSVGMQKRVAIARSWAMDPKLLLMDEPTAGLDNYNRRNLLPLIDNMRILFHTTIVIVTHDLLMAKELNCNISFFHQKKITEPKSFDYWLHSDTDIARDMFRDLRNYE